MSIDPGADQEREKVGEGTAVRQDGHSTSDDVHRALFEEAPEPRTLEELKEGARRHARRRQGRR